MTERDAAKSKELILCAAEEEFSAKGFYGARVDEIASKAHINKRMIYVYFEDKEGLYKQVLFRVYQRAENMEKELISRHYQGMEMIRQIINAYFDFLADTPSFVNILMWENLNQGNTLKELEDQKIERRTIRYFVDELEKGRKSGIFRADIDPFQTAVSLITTCFANFSNQYTLSKLFHTDLTSREKMEERKQHTIQMLTSYLSNECEGGNDHVCNHME